MPRSSRTPSRKEPLPEPGDGSPAPDGNGAPEAATLSYRQAQAALELCLAELQSSDLDVEAMASLYRRAQAYADRCETILRQVEQEVEAWDPEQPEAPPQPYTP